MKAVIVNHPGNAEQLQIKEYEKPQLQPGEILIHVKAAAINRTDILSREGKAGYMSNPILGIEVSGEVVEASHGVTLTSGYSCYGTR